MLVGLVLPAYMIRKLGQEAYGVWVLTFSLIDFAWIVDLGTGTAVQMYAARHHARRATGKLNELVNTGLVCCAVLAALVLAAVVALAPKVPDFFHVPEVFRRDAMVLFLLVGGSFAHSEVLRVFNASLEGLQRFDLVNMLRVTVMAVRATVCMGLLYWGAGLVALGVVTALSEAATYWLYYLAFRRLQPEFRFSTRLVKRAVFKELVGYVRHSAVAGISGVLAGFSAPVIIARYRPISEVGYFGIVSRIVQQFAVLADRASTVTASRTAHLSELGQRERIVSLSVYANRYMLCLFLPVASLLLLYGREIIALWINPETAERCMPLVPVIVLGTMFARAGQSASGAMLFGLAKHQWYSWAMLAEAGLSIGMSLVLVRDGGMVAVAYVFFGLMAVNRGLFTPWLLCRHTGANWGAYMWGVYGRPILVTAPVFGLAYWLKPRWLPGQHWGELVAAGVLVGGCFLVLAVRFCLTQEHRRQAWGWLAQRLPKS